MSTRTTASSRCCARSRPKTYGQRGTNVRLHIVAGPGDPTDRFTYWPVRIDKGGKVLAPGDMNNPVQFDRFPGPR